MVSTRLDDEVGRVVSGRYRLVAPLGSGSSAQVFLADDVNLGRQVAVKMLQPALADDDRFLRRFRTEAQTTTGARTTCRTWSPSTWPAGACGR